MVNDNTIKRNFQTLVNNLKIYSRQKKEAKKYEKLTLIQKVGNFVDNTALSIFAVVMMIICLPILVFTFGILFAYGMPRKFIRSMYRKVTVEA